MKKHNIYLKFAFSNVKFINFLAKLRTIKIYLILLFLTNSCLISKNHNINDQDKLSYHLHKNCNQVISVINEFNQKLNNQNPEILYANSDYEGFIGILTGIFLSDQKCAKKIIKTSDHYHQFTKFILLKTLLYSKIDQKIINNFVFKNNFHQYLENFKNIRDINQLIPDKQPSDNDLLIGVFTSTGNYQYIDAILKNYVNHKKQKEMILDCLRFGNAIALFGDPKDINHYILIKIQDSIKKKYSPEINKEQFFKILTLSTAMWSVRSISHNNEDLKNHINQYFKTNDLEELFVRENVVISNLSVLISLDKIYDEILKNNSNKKDLIKAKTMKNLIKKFIKQFYSLEYPDEKTILKQK